MSGYPVAPYGLQQPGVSGFITLAQGTKIAVLDTLGQLGSRYILAAPAYVTQLGDSAVASYGSPIPPYGSPIPSYGLQYPQSLVPGVPGIFTLAQGTKIAVLDHLGQPGLRYTLAAPASVTQFGGKKNKSQQGKGKNKSQQGKGKNMSQHGSSKNKSQQGKGKNMSQQGKGKNKSQQGKGKNMSQQGWGKHKSQHNNSQQKHKW